MVTFPKGLRHHWVLRLRAMRGEFTNQLITEPLEPVLHASGRRLIWLGASVVAAHLVFWWVWNTVLPQSFENLFLRLSFAGMGLALIYMGLHAESPGVWRSRLAGTIFWLQLPCFTFFMYLANERNSIWLATLMAVTLVYHTISDWRLASIGTALGFLAAYLAFEITTPTGTPGLGNHNSPAIDAFVIGFGWAVGAMLGLSAANRRKEQLIQTLATIGIMAHELRTPLSSVGLIANSLDKLALIATEPLVIARLKELSARTQSLTVQMNYQIDSQITNARFENLPITSEKISAADLVNWCVRQYPFKSKKEARCWSVEIVEDFDFNGSKALMGQVFSNLIKNAITALRKANSDFAAGSLTVKVHVHKKKGYITVKDKGTGIDPLLLRSIFEPFFSTNFNTGHGLGLAFCRKVVRLAGGELSVQSQVSEGASFIIELPL